MPLYKPQHDKCRKCEDELEISKQTIDNRPAKTYISMAKVIQERGHDKTKHQKIVDEMLTMITESIAKTLNPGIYLTKSITKSKTTTIPDLLTKKFNNRKSFIK